MAGVGGVAGEKCRQLYLKNNTIKNIARDIEIKNIVTTARGEWGGDSGDRGL